MIKGDPTPHKAKLVFDAVIRRRPSPGLHKSVRSGGEAA